MMRVAVGISGGVDSAAAALLLKERGHDVFALTMRLGLSDEDKTVNEARMAAERLGLEFVEADFSKEWSCEVLEYLRTTYLSGETPNPCVRCNETVKLSLLPKKAFELGADMFATGHYARIENGRIYRAADHRKDQSYFLYRVDREILKRLLLPLGDMTKSEVREFVRSRGIEIASKADSQDFCGGDLHKIINAPEKEGDIVTVAGKVIGRHKGFWNYTVGKRKGLGVGGGIPFYVVRLDAENNRVIVAPKEAAAVDQFAISEVLWHEDISNLNQISVKVRSAGEPRLVKDFSPESNVFRLAEAIGGIASGQSAVFYSGDRLLGGGIIV